MKQANPSPPVIYDAVICGGGMVGLAQAVALAREGMHVAVVDRGAFASQLTVGFDGRVSAVAYGSQCILDAIGVWKHMADYAQPIWDIRVSDGSMPFFLHYDHKEVGETPMGYIVENRHIRAALQQAAAALPTLTCIEGASPLSIERDEATATLLLDNGTALRGRLLLAADGKQSRLRELAGIAAVEWNYKQTAIVCTIEHEWPHQGLAQERFLPAGPFAVLPMTGNRSSLVWVEPDERVQIYMELEESEFVQEIEERVGTYLGTLRTVGPRFAYPLNLLHAKTYVGHRLALIGDAAHGMHPIAGQGVNLGFRDVGVMTELLVTQHRLGLDIGSDEVLSHYQRWRRFDNTTMLAVTDGLNRLFGNGNLPVRLARGLGLWAVGQMPPLKKLFIRHAMGLVGDVPKMVNERRSGN